MLDDTRMTYLHDGTPRTVTIDGVDYDPTALRVLIWRGRNLGWLIALALLNGIVIGGALVLVFTR